MDRTRTLSRLAALAAGAFAVSLIASGPAEARGKRRGKVNAEAIGELMGDFKFGMTKQQVLKVLQRKISKEYKEKIKETNSVYEQDELRRERGKEIRRIKKSYIEFEGERTGWDVSIIDDQFAHNTGESMMVHWENVDGKDQRRFFFFHQGRLYKMFIALGSDMLKRGQREFSYFRRIMESRYGPGEPEHKAGPEGEKRAVALRWRTRRHTVRAIDKLEFYGSFCLMIVDPGKAKQLAKVRESMRAPEKKNRIIDSIIADEEDEGPSLDENSGAVDSILND